jgi:hypothetical protein
VGEHPRHLGRRLLEREFASDGHNGEPEHYAWPPRPH